MSTRRNKELWYKKNIRRFILGGHLPDKDQQEFSQGILNNVDPYDIVCRLKKSGVQAFLFYAKCLFGNAYYPTKTGHMHSCLNGRDFFGELVVACKKEGIIPLGIYECEDHRIKQFNSSWCHQDSATPCFFSPYREYCLNQLQEIVTNYDIQGVYLDMVDFAAGSCLYCEREFKKQFGKGIPKEENWGSGLFKSYVQWRYETIGGFLQECSTLIKKINPSVSFTHNFHGTPNLDWKWGNSDVVCSNIDDFMWADVFSIRNGHIINSEVTRFFYSLKGMAPELLVDGVRAGAGDSFTPKPFLMYFTEAMAVVSNGGAFQSSGLISSDGTVDKRIMNVVKKINNEIKKREKWLLGSNPLEFARILFSQNTRDFYGGTECKKYISSFNGVYKALIESHIPVAIISDKDLMSEKLSSYKIIILPNAVCLSDESIKALLDYVKNGGKLIASSGVSLADEKGNKRTDFGLGPAMGIQFLSFSEKGKNYVELLGKMRENFQGSNPFQLSQPHIRTKHIDEQTAIFGEFHYPFVFKQRHTDYSNYDPKSSGVPAITFYPYGKGGVVYFAFDPGSFYLEQRYPEAKYLLEKAVRILSTPPVLLEAPPCVELTCFTQPGKRLFHLINSQPELGQSILPSSRGEIIESVIPIFDIKMKIKVSHHERIKRIYWAPDEKDLEFTKNGDFLVAKIPKLEVHGIVVLELE